MAETPHAVAAAPSGAGLLRVRGLHAQLGDRPVLCDVDATFPSGWTAIVGPNGAGKSTLLRALAGLQPPQRGHVTIGDLAVREMKAAARARQLAWLSQGGEISGELSVRETVELGRIAQRGLLGAFDRSDHDAVERAMQRTGCSAWATRAVQALSGGERQRVLLARVLATEAPILLLDEPTTHLDAPQQVALASLLRSLAREQTIVTALHDLQVALHADRLLVLRAGRVRAEGPVREPAVLQALEEVFDRAVRVHATAGEPLRPVLVIDDEVAG